MISCWANLPQFPLRKCFKVLQRATRCYKVYQSATKCYTVLECFLWESATRVEKVVLLGRLSHSLNRKYDPWQGTYILLGNDGFRKIQNTAIGSCYQHHSCQRNLKGVFHQDLRAAGLMDQPTLFREKILLWIPQMQNKHCTNKTQCQPCKRLAWPIIPNSWSSLVWKRVSPMDVIALGQSTIIFLCIRPYSAWWQPNVNPAQACSGPVRRQSFAKIQGAVLVGPKDQLFLQSCWTTSLILSY